VIGIKDISAQVDWLSSEVNEEARAFLRAVLVEFPYLKAGASNGTFCTSLLRPQYNFSLFSLPVGRGFKLTGRKFFSSLPSPPLPIKVSSWQRLRHLVHADRQPYPLRIHQERIVLEHASKFDPGIRLLNLCW